MTKLEAAITAYAAMTDADKAAFLGLQLDGGDDRLAFDDQDIADAFSDVSDAYRDSFERIDEAVDTSMVDRGECYDGGAWDWQTSRGVTARARSVAA
jgi:hypothetical protein